MLDLSRLNPPQREAVTVPEGPLLVLAGAGSGKTRVIAHRVAWLLEKGVKPSEILAVTFTNKAAAEMRERVRALAGKAGGKVQVQTFHAFGLWFLGEEHKAAKLPRRFAICDAGDQLTMLKRCMDDVKLGERRLDAKRLLSMLSRAKNTGEVASGTGVDGDYAAMVEELLPRYRQALKAQRSLDFDDLVLRPAELLEGNAALRARWRERFPHLLVDEYQDTNRGQLRLLELLSGGPWKGRSLCAVGDDDQAIYGWRGAEVANIRRFERNFPGARVVRLEQNYRSTSNILACANGVIARSEDRRPKKLWTDEPPGERVRLLAAVDEEEEARRVAAEVSRLRGEGRDLAHVAVLYRLNVQSRAIEEALRVAGIPHAVRGGPAFFSRSEVRDVLAWLKVCVHPGDDVSLARVVNVPPRGIGDASLARLGEWAYENGRTLHDALGAAESVPDLPRGAPERMVELHRSMERWRRRLREGSIADGARALVADLGLIEYFRSGVASPEAASRRIDAVDGVIRSLEAWEKRTVRPDLSEFLARLALDSRDEEPEEAEGVTLMTLHAAKGLEFPVVFLVGVEEDLLPVAGIQGESRDLEEERRLAYVGITRAREVLWITRAGTRPVRGRLVPRTPSRFLDDLPKEAVVDADSISSPAEAAARSADVLAALRARLPGRRP